MTIIELVWTLLPVFVLIAIAFPSFRLLYLMDNFYVNQAFDLLNLAVVSVSNLKSDSLNIVVRDKKRIKP